jgi:uncharacterized membrane protein YGL010W
MISLKLMLTGVLLFLLSFLAAQVDAPRTATWWEALVAIIFIIALLLFFGGGFAVIWLLIP